MTFLQKSYGEYSNIEKPVLVTTSYEGSDDEKELDMVSIFNQNNGNSDIVSDSNSDSDNKSIVDEDINNNIEATLKTTIKAKEV